MEIEKRKKDNYTGDNELTNGINTENIVNLEQFGNTSPEFLDNLAKYQFAETPASEKQLFNIYEENDYKNIPNFISTDLYLQFFHMYFSYIMRNIEKEKMYPLLKKMTYALYNSAKSLEQYSTDPEIKRYAQFNEVFYAIPYTLLTQKSLPVPQIT